MFVDEQMVPATPAELDIEIYNPYERHIDPIIWPLNPIPVAKPDLPQASLNIDILNQLMPTLQSSVAGPTLFSSGNTFNMANSHLNFGVLAQIPTGGLSALSSLVNSTTQAGTVNTPRVGPNFGPAFKPSASAISKIDGSNFKPKPDSKPSHYQPYPNAPKGTAGIPKRGNIKNK
jgi:hypothetical protein